MASPVAKVRFIHMMLSLIFGKQFGLKSRPRRGLQLGLLPYDHLGADRDAVIEVGDVGID
jgi:hypothetical protein